MSCNVTFVGGPWHGHQEHMHEPYPPVYNIRLHQTPELCHSDNSEIHPSRVSMQIFIYKRLNLRANEYTAIVYIPNDSQPSEMLEYIVQCLKSIK